MRRFLLIIACSSTVFFEGFVLKAENPLIQKPNNLIKNHLADCIKQSDKAVFSSTISVLLQSGWKTQDFETLLGRAATSDTFFFLDLLVAMGCDINTKNYNDQSILFFYVENSKHKDVETYLGHLVFLGLQVDATDKDGNQALHHAANYDRTDIIDELVHIFRVDVNARGGNGETSLMISARCGRVNATKTLLRAGADVSLRDQDGRTALDLAQIQLSKEGSASIADSRQKNENIISLKEIISLLRNELGGGQ